MSILTVAAKDGSSYQRAFAQLMDTIRAVLNGRALPNRTVDLEPLDFDLYLKAKTQGFVGRQWLKAEVLDAIAATDAPPVLLLVGEPGWGKTVFARPSLDADPEGRLISAAFLSIRSNRHRRSSSFCGECCRDCGTSGGGISCPASRADQEKPGAVQQSNAAEKFETPGPRTAERTRFKLIRTAAALHPCRRARRGYSIRRVTTSSGIFWSEAQGLLPPWLKLIVTTRERSDILDFFPQACCRSIRPPRIRGQRFRRQASDRDHTQASN